ncbi:NADH:flavin oxidoreductase/NADH oxidase [Streptomyces sp. NBC_00825]|uniref:NADH:flavin oxidoreductase/NADH oxidase n=1 Tax=unclassified Streptomyces TaxID=2593676 RepID=UPI002258278A|nr:MULTISPECIES: NADH:flavin oxidoreductase/NADH oxidase [unclassified Streptomyces]WTB52571.1 NADH:flavin oxidoreductase/NADH oxidase [Streptomyces sp. NBC_00826]WTH94537.1 NADH:flavin oxidoreductase/NADH oxidase [Streptomyces sp. NBC_00825]WTI03272.1 NADH:flavin oxidoreductase/NADH oxidase [Streptomyces sp. NBC_00822]MCX4868820.1 NADH:flavin oxidoreductase/NADH oxidase [Streptomyces sp. NBC_00906]MCX4900058.1 NADH:flavin oxidoreductase/NADH oxidase [Streptomyces sp. NBC_00892]
MSALFEPYTLRSLVIPNRVWMAPMCQYCAAPDGPEQGVATDWHFAHLAARAIGGTGLILTEATAVSPEGRISPGDLGIWNDTQVAALRRITAFIKGQGSVAGIQLAHAGRKASTAAPWLGGAPVGPEAHGWTPVAPSPLPFDDGHPVPHELTVDGIREVVDQFREAARRAVDAGFQVAEVHGAHGYLIGQFLSPHSNRRTDEYGGSFENRTRLALEVVDAVREVWPQELPVFFRISATDWLTENDEDDREGWTADETVRLAALLQVHGVDLLDVSSGGNAPRARIETGPGYQVPFAGRVRAETTLPVAAVGLITEPQQAEKIITEGWADAVLLGRELLRSPSWAQAAARELGGELRTPEQYHRAV